ncbi:unnamed protein product [Polarella glacialis]|uniref:Uncharacterized protein n=1 Tax=Polarella glacialis TaxID=89957 RepID=A0A813E8C7_POLGL|nr:unnamed protein product [Polarella glacialis]
MQLAFTIAAAVLVGAVLVAVFDPWRWGEGPEAVALGNRLFGTLQVGAICGTVIGLQYGVAGMDSLTRVGKRLNLQRKVQHVASGVIILFLFHVLPLQTSQLALGASVVAFSLVQLARHLSTEMDEQFLALFGPMLKEEERQGIRPPVTFPRQLAVLGMMTSTFADPLAAVGGLCLGGPQLFGRSNKTLSLVCS